MIPNTSNYININSNNIENYNADDNNNNIIINDDDNDNLYCY